MRLIDADELKARVKKSIRRCCREQCDLQRYPNDNEYCFAGD